MSELQDKIQSTKDEIVKIKEALLINPNSEYDKEQLAKRQAELEDLTADQQTIIGLDIAIKDEQGSIAPEPTTEAPKTEQKPPQPKKKSRWRL